MCCMEQEGAAHPGLHTGTGANRGLSRQHSASPGRSSPRVRALSQRTTAAPVGRSLPAACSTAACEQRLVCCCACVCAQVDGATVVWDLKKQRPVITLKDPNRWVDTCGEAWEAAVKPGTMSLVWLLKGLAPERRSGVALYSSSSSISSRPVLLRACCCVPPGVHLCSQRRCSVLQWNPDVATQLVVASEDDRTPTLQMWDLRNSMSPVKEFVGHVKVGDLL